MALHSKMKTMMEKKNKIGIKAGLKLPLKVSEMSTEPQPQKLLSSLTWTVGQLAALNSKLYCLASYIWI